MRSCPLPPSAARFLRAPASSAGLTLVEVMVAVVVLGIGIVALAGASGLTARALGQARAAAAASRAAASRMELLRAQAGATRPRCAALADGADSAFARGLTIAWSVTAAGHGRLLRVVTSRPAPGRVRHDTLASVVDCS